MRFGCCTAKGADTLRARTWSAPGSQGWDSEHRPDPVASFEAEFADKFVDKYVKERAPESWRCLLDRGCHMLHQPPDVSRVGD
jgi:hypothetical protein